jgi:DNA polymerase III subunit gamma/tau
VAYVSLYRKYRPQTFEEVVGQGHVIQTLVHALEEDRLHHAYLFTGPRGTGKTSTARLLAKAINCEQGPTPSPCNVCEHCTSIADGSSVDVIELDMASHGGVDDARELRDRALYAPARARRKVYILDEVHMASTAAFNALLKLIEEPPGHVMFAMATTDPQKVLPTILSRVQRLDLRRVSATDVAGNVRKLCELEGYAIDDGAVEAIVRAGDGSLRDTQSVLEQVLAFAGTDVSAEAVAQVLGQTPAERVFETVDLLGERDVAGLLALVQGLLDDGHDLRRFTLDLVQHVRDLLVLQVAPDRPDLVDATDDRRRRMQAQTAALPSEALLRSVGLLAATVAEQRQGSPRLPLELTLAKLAVPGADGDVAELADRVARLEAGTPTPRRVAAADPAPTATGNAADVRVASAQLASAAEPTRAETAAAPGGVGSDERTSPPGATARAATAEAPTPASAPKETPLQARARARSVGKSEVAGEQAPATQEAAAAPESPTGGRSEAAPTSESPTAGAPTPEDRATDDRAVEGPSTDESAPDPAADELATDEPAAADLPAGEPAPVEHAVARAEAEQADDARRPGDDLDVLQRHWDGVLDLVKRRSRRCHAVFEPATVTAVSRGIVTLRYAPRYASFHAQNATKGEYADVLKESIERACGLKLRVEAIVEGAGDERRRPVPPSVTPDDARVPVLDDGPSAAEEAEVREAEHGGTSAPAEVGMTDALLASELGAELLDERPPPDAPTT